MSTNSTDPVEFNGDNSSIAAATTKSTTTTATTTTSETQASPSKRTAPSFVSLFCCSAVEQPSTVRLQYSSPPSSATTKSFTFITHKTATPKPKGAPLLNSMQTKVTAPQQQRPTQHSLHSPTHHQLLQQQQQQQQQQSNNANNTTQISSTTSGTTVKHQMGVSNSKSHKQSTSAAATPSNNKTTANSQSQLSNQQQNTNQQTSAAISNTSSTQPSPTANTSITDKSMPPPVKAGLLPPLSSTDAAKGKKTLVLDLDETLVHSSFKPIPNADFVISIELEGVIHRVYVRKRPGVDMFLKQVSAKWEVVIFTASLSKYADPLLDILDKNKVIVSRLFREHCVQHHGNYVKDMTQLGRRVDHVVIVDNSPFSYMFQPENAIAISSWFNDKSDRQLYELLPFLEELSVSDDVIEAMAQRAMHFETGNAHGPIAGASIPTAPGLTTGLIAQYTNPDVDD